jgi:hypothetical protein
MGQRDLRRLLISGAMTVVRGKPESIGALRARHADLDPILDFHTGPRRVNCRTMRPNTRKRLTTCANPKKALASTGASTHD